MADRPTYENEGSRRAEEEVLDFLLGADVIKARWRTPRYYPCDWVVRLHGDRLGLLEVKVRKQQYRDYMLSLHKATALIEMAQVGGFRPMLAVAWQDVQEIGVWKHLEAEMFKPSIGGRNDRGDSQDMEPVVMIPLQSAQRFIWRR